jgi:hypothetical protein
VSPPIDPRRAGVLVGIGLSAGACDSFSAADSSAAPPLGIADGGNAMSVGTASRAGSPGLSPVFQPPPPPVCPSGDSDGGEPNPMLPYAVSHADVGRSVLYSWTTVEQIEELRTDPTLLTRSASAAGERGRASDYIAELAATGDAMATVLAGADYERKRFAWTNPWATVLGWAGENYGDQLLEIRLRPQSLIGRLDRRSATWAFYDVDNAPVDSTIALASPGRIAAVYFVDDREVNDCGGTFGNGPAYREYFVCNEAMIAGWSARTDAIRTALVGAVEALGVLERALAAMECRIPDGDLACWREHVVAVWGREPRGLVESYEAGLTFPNDLYMPSANNIARLVAAIELAEFEPDPLIHDNP